MRVPVPSCSVIILAAGLGKRMKSDMAKVLHEIHGRAMVAYVAEAALQVAGQEVVVVVGHQAELVRNAVSASVEGPVRFAMQQEQLGTGHAVSCAMPFLGEKTEQVVILYGDVPLLAARTIRRLADDHSAAKRELTVLAVQMKDPTGYGRIVTDEAGGLKGIVEEADASAEQKRIDQINTGIYCVSKEFLAETLPLLSADNAQGEYYLTDIVKIGYRQGRRMGMVLLSDADELIGVNSMEELARARQIMTLRLR